MREGKGTRRKREGGEEEAEEWREKEGGRMVTERWVKGGKGGRTKARGDELVQFSPCRYLVCVSPLEDTVWWWGGGDNGSVPHRLQPLHKLIKSHTTLLVLVKVL